MILKSMKKFRSDSTKELDLGGKTLIPGFIESHAHLLALGKKSRQLDLTELKSYDELLEKVKDAVSQTPKGVNDSEASTFSRMSLRLFR